MADVNYSGENTKKVLNASTFNPNQSFILPRAKCNYSTKILFLYFKNYIPMAST